MNPRIDQRIASITVAPKTLLTPATKEIITDAASCGVWVNRTPRQVSLTAVGGSTPSDIGHAISIEHAPSPFLIVIFGTSPPCGMNGSLQVANKCQPTYPALVWNTQQLDDVVDGKLPNDLDSASIFSKVMGYKLSDGSSDDLYLRYRMEFLADVVQTQTPQFMDMGLPAINTLD